MPFWITRAQKPFAIDAIVVLPDHLTKGSIIAARIAAARDGKLWLEAA